MLAACHKSAQHQFSPNNISRSKINKRKGYEIYSIDDRRENTLIFYQILSTILKRNVWRSVWRICIWILGLKGLRELNIRNIPVYLHRFHLHSSYNKAFSNVFFRDLQVGTGSYKWMDHQTNIATVYIIIWTRCNRQTVKIIMWYVTYQWDLHTSKAHFLIFTHRPISLTLQFSHLNFSAYHNHDLAVR